MLIIISSIKNTKMKHLKSLKKTKLKKVISKYSNTIIKFLLLTKRRFNIKNTDRNM